MLCFGHHGLTASKVMGLAALLLWGVAAHVSRT